MSSFLPWYDRTIADLPSPHPIHHHPQPHSPQPLPSPASMNEAVYSSTKSKKGHCADAISSTNSNLSNELISPPPTTTSIMDASSLSMETDYTRDRKGQRLWTELIAEYHVFCDEVYKYMNLLLLLPHHLQHRHHRLDHQGNGRSRHIYQWEKASSVSIDANSKGSS